MKDETKTLQYGAKMSNFEVINEDFTRCRCNVFYCGRNRNYSDITENALDKFIKRKGYANVPVVAHLMKIVDKDGNVTYKVGAHDEKIQISDAGIEIINECVPFGVIPEDCNPSMDEIVEKSGCKRKYFSVDIILWTHRYPIMEASYGQDIYFNQSMEIKPLDVFYDEQYEVVDDFSLSALCLLHLSDSKTENEEPCFESSRVKKFALENKEFNKDYDSMVDNLKKYNLISDDSSKELKNKQLNNELDKKGEPIQMVDTSKFIDMIGKITYERNGEQAVKYHFINADEHNVYVIDNQDYRIYSAPWAQNEDVCVISWEDKVEGTIGFMEKSKDEKSYMDIILNTITEDKTKEYDIKYEILFKEKSDILENKLVSDNEAHEKKYSELEQKYLTANKELNEYKIVEIENARKLHIKEVENLIAKYDEKLHDEFAFIQKCSEIKGKEADIDIEKLTTEFDLISGRALMAENADKKFSRTSLSTSPLVNYSKKNEEFNAFGDLLSRVRQ